MTYYTVNIDPSQASSDRFRALMNLCRARGEVREIIPGRQYFWKPRADIGDMETRLSQHPGVMVDKEEFKEIKGRGKS